MTAAVAERLYYGSGSGTAGPLDFDAVVTDIRLDSREG